MSNKYLIKISEKVEIRKRLEDGDMSREIGRGVLYSAGGALFGRRIGRDFGKSFKAEQIGATLGAVAAGFSGANASHRNQLREQQNHDIKLQGAAQRQEAHDARMHKFAALSNEAKKDIVGTGTIAALGGLGSLAVHKVLPHNASSAKVLAVGTGIGLGADYLGLKIGQAYSKHLDHGANRSLAKHANRK